MDKPQTVVIPTEIPNNIDEILERKFEERELNSLDYSDELKTNVKNYAKANNMSIGQAIKSPFMDFLKVEEDKKAKSEDASIGSKHRSPSSQDFTKVDPTKDFDLSTKEGQESYQAWKKQRDSQG